MYISTKYMFYIYRHPVCRNLTNEQISHYILRAAHGCRDPLSCRSWDQNMRTSHTWWHMWWWLWWLLSETKNILMAESPWEITHKNARLLRARIFTLSLTQQFESISWAAMIVFSVCLPPCPKVRLFCAFVGLIVCGEVRKSRLKMWEVGFSMKRVVPSAFLKKVSLVRLWVKSS